MENLNFSTGSVFADFMILGLFGVLVHCLMKLHSLQKDAAALKISFKPSDYFNRDYIWITLSVVMVFVWLFVFDEIIKRWVWMGGYLKISFFLWGLLGSYFIQQFFGGSKKWIRQQMEEKLNIKLEADSE